MAVGSITTATGSLLRYYDKLLLDWEKPQLRMMQFAQKRPCPANTGTAVYFTGYRPLAKPTAAISAEESGAVQTRFGTRQITATVAEWGLTARMSKLLSMVKIDPGFEEQISLVADNASRTLDYQLQKLIAKQGSWGLSISGTTSDHQTVIVSNGSTTSSGTSGFYTTAATSFYTGVSNLGDWGGAYATVVSDIGSSNSTDTIKYGWAGRVTSVTPFPTSGDYVLLSTTAPAIAAPEAFTAGDRVRLVCQSNAYASNMSSTHFARAQRDLIMNRAVPFGGGYYAAGIPAAMLYSMKLDPTWVAAGQYSATEQLYRGEVGRWYGSRVYEMTEPYRETDAGVEDEASGAIHHAFFTGKNAFGHTELEGGSQKLYVVNGQADSNEPIPRNAYVSWYHVFAQRALTAPWCVAVTGAVAA